MNTNDPYVKAMFGQNAVHVGVNFTVQGQGDNVLLIGVSKVVGPHPLLFGSKRIHQLLMGDMVFRPHLVVESNHLQGMGVSGIITGGMADMDEWVVHGNILLRNR